MDPNSWKKLLKSKIQAYYWVLKAIKGRIYSFTYINIDLEVIATKICNI